MTTRNTKGQFIKTTTKESTEPVPISLRDLIAIEAMKIYLTVDPGYPTNCAENAYRAADVMLYVRTE